MSNKKKIATLILVAIVAIGSYFVAGTYAKYTSDVTGTDTATVAKWKWVINSTTIDSADDASYTFNLFDAIKDSNGSTNETDVATGKKIAPGTSGSFDIDIENQSEVNATYAIAFTETNASSVPIEYSTDGTNWTNTIGSLNVGATAINMNTSATTTTVYWRWAFSPSAAADTTDTALGFGANTSAATVQVNAKITVTQVD